MFGALAPRVAHEVHALHEAGDALVLHIALDVPVTLLAREGLRLFAVVLQVASEARALPVALLLLAILVALEVIAQPVSFSFCHCT